MRYWTWKDPRGCSERVSAAALLRGHQLVDGLDVDVAYVRTVNYGNGLAGCRGALNNLKECGVPSVPHWRYSDLYDDKWAQASVLRPWLPETHLIGSPEEVPDFKPPFVSKSKNGSASKCVRMIETKEEAQAEVSAAFGDGIVTPRGAQRGYLIWQRFVPDNSGDIRVCVTGDVTYGLFRGNRKEVPFASGSGNLAPVTSIGGKKTTAAFLLCDEVAQKLGMRWACFDVIFDGDDPLVLEVSFSWTEQAYDNCPLFERGTLVPTGRTASSWPELVVDEMERSCRG